MLQGRGRIVEGDTRQTALWEGSMAETGWGSVEGCIEKGKGWRKSCNWGHSPSPPPWLQLQPWLRPAGPGLLLVAPKDKVGGRGKWGRGTGKRGKAQVGEMLGVRGQGVQTWALPPPLPTHCFPCHSNGGQGTNEKMTPQYN